jgi:hypothetical protein
LTARRAGLHPIIVVNLGVTALYVLTHVLLTDEFARIRAIKEGPIEHVSHAALLVALVLWVMAARGLSGSARTLAAFVVAYVAFLFVEEIDWGLVYGVDIGFQRLVGLPSFHQTTWRNEHIWQDKLYWIGAPLLLYFGLPRLRWLGGKLARFEPTWPSARESVAFAIVLITFMAVDRFVKNSISTYQALIYALLASVAARAGQLTWGRRQRPY